MSSFLDIFKEVDVNASYTPQQLQDFFLGVKSQVYELNNTSEPNISPNQIKPQPVPSNIPVSLLEQDVLEEVKNPEKPDLSVPEIIKSALITNNHKVDEITIKELLNRFSNINWDNISNYKEAITNIFESVKKTDVIAGDIKNIQSTNVNDENIINTINNTDSLYPVPTISNNTNKIIENIIPIKENDKNIPLPEVTPIGQNIELPDEITSAKQDIKISEGVTPVKQDIKIPENIIKDTTTKLTNVEHNVDNSKSINPHESSNENITTNIEDNIHNLLIKEIGTKEQNIEKDKNEIVEVNDGKVTSVLDKEELTTRNILSIGDNIQDKLDVIFRNTGGDVPGEGHTDTVPAMLTPGEYVVNKDSTKEFKPLLESINNGGLTRKNVTIDKNPESNVLKLQEGGLVRSQPPSPINIVQNKEISKDLNEAKTSEAIQKIGNSESEKESETENASESQSSKNTGHAGSEGFDNIRDPAYLMRITAWERITGGAARVNTI